MSGTEDLYALLGVPRDAGLDLIRSAWRALVRELHPDRNPGDREADVRFRRISAAWSVLSDPDRRLVYDHLGLEVLRPGLLEELVAALREAKPPAPRRPATATEKPGVSRGQPRHQRPRNEQAWTGGSSMEFVFRQRRR